MSDDVVEIIMITPTEIPSASRFLLSNVTQKLVEDSIGLDVMIEDNFQELRRSFLKSVDTLIDVPRKRCLSVRGEQKFFLRELLRLIHLHPDNSDALKMEQGTVFGLRSRSPTSGTFFCIHT